MVSAAGGSFGVLRYHALTMAAGSHMSQRIESLLILREGRTFSRGMTRMGWLAVILCAIPLAAGAGAVELDHQMPRLIFRMPARRVPLFIAEAQANLPTEAGMQTDGATFQCEDLSSAGLVLVPVSSPDYESLLNDIQHRIDNPPPEVAGMPEMLRRFMVGRIDPDKRATSAILLNRSGKSIAMMELVWRYEEVGGRTYTRSRPENFGKRILLPFSTPTLIMTAAAYQKIQAYWNTILPGSKRYLGEDRMAGDNTDVRLPASDEVWKSGGGSGNAGGGRRAQNPVSPSSSPHR